VTGRTQNHDQSNKCVSKGREPTTTEVRKTKVASSFEMWSEPPGCGWDK